ncbi:MAG: hypothetical protein E6I28_13550 [Chloroflexi bacterium]|nr:MAG: hypothetical protein E6I28_13550 [Chloroflexota bacterium]
MSISNADLKAALEILRNAQFVYGLSRYPKKQVLDDPIDVKTLRGRLEAMRAAAKGLSAAQREKLDVPWADLEAIDSGTEAVWKAAKRATPKIIAELTPLVRDEPEAAFLIAPTKRGRTSEVEPREKLKERPKDKPKTQVGLTGTEIAGLELAIQRRIAAEEAYFTWLRGNHSLPPAEWAKRRAHAERARSAEDLYVEKLFKSRSARTP